MQLGLNDSSLNLMPGLSHSWDQVLCHHDTAALSRALSILRTIDSQAPFWMNQTSNWQESADARHGTDASGRYRHEPRETSAGPAVSLQLEIAGLAANGKTDPALHQEAVNFVSPCEWMEANAGAIISTS